MFPRVRLAELIATMAIATDLGLGLPLDHVLLQALIAMRLASEAGFDESQLGDLYYAALLPWVGCWVDAHEQAKWWGDDLAVKREIYRSGRNPRGAALTWFAVRQLGPGRPPIERLGVAARFVADGRHEVGALASNHCIAAHALAVRIGVSDASAAALLQTWERWDGRGAPNGLAGEQISPAARLVAVADVAAFHTIDAGTEAAVEMVQQYSGTLLDPALAELYAARAHALLSDEDRTDPWQAVAAAERGTVGALDDAALDRALIAIAAFADVKSPFTIGHSERVAAIAAGAAEAAGLSEAERTRVRRAALVAQLGRLGVSNGIWDKPAPLTLSEQERVRMHPYLMERMLARSPALADLAALAVFQQERLDGSGYPRALSADAIPLAARILAAADAYCAMREPRPHRAALSATEAEAELRAEARAGRLDGGAVENVLHAAGHRASRQPTRPAGLTAREVDVLQLLALGLSNRQIADELTVSPRTVGTHVEHIYAKSGATNRATASLFAARHGLL